MIYITQGHQNSIGPEIFFKALLQLPTAEWGKLRFVASSSVVESTLNQLKITYQWKDEVLVLPQASLTCLLIDKIQSSLPPSTLALEMALAVLKPKDDILLTLPTAKDQLIFKGEKTAGYTEYLRARYQTPDTAMLFMAPDDLTLLVTDHIPLEKVSRTLTTDLIFSKVANCLKGMNKYFKLPQEVIFAGINPHCGENGLLGTEDQVIVPAITRLSKSFPKCKFLGPYSADTLHFHKRDVSQLKVYMYHDQGLPLFKALHGTIGLNISLGLPFLRMSVDHGTAFDLYGKNVADASGALFLITSALKVQKTISE